MAVLSLVRDAASAAGQALRGMLRTSWEKARSVGRRARQSGEAKMAQLFTAGGQYTWPGGWSLDKQEQVRHYVQWYYVTAQIICNSYACRVPQVGYRVPPEEVHREKNKRLLDRRQRLKALTHIQQHEDIELVDSDHPLLKLLNNPNGPDVGYTARFREMLFSLLTGESYLWKVRNSIPGPKGRQVAELWPIFPHWVEPRPGTTRLVESYIVRPVVSGSGGGRGLEIPAEDMIPILDPSPLSLVRGWSPLQAGAAWVDTAEAIDRARWQLFENGLFPTILLKLAPEVFGPQGPDRAALKRFKTEFDQETLAAGQGKHGKAVILSPGVDVALPSRGPAEMDFVNSGDAIRDQILAIQRVSKVKAGISTEVNKATAQVADQSFHQDTMGPKLTHRAQIFTEHLAQDFDEELIIFYPDQTPDDPEQINADIKLDLEALAITPNEVRKLRGREPYELGGDNPMGPGGLPIPLNVEEQSGVDMYGEMQSDREQQQQQSGDEEVGAEDDSDDFSWMGNGKSFNPNQRRGQPANRGQFGSSGSSGSEEGRGETSGLLKRAWSTFRAQLERQFHDLESFYGRPVSVAIIGVAALPLPGTAAAPLAAKLLAGAVRYVSGKYGKKSAPTGDMEDYIDAVESLWETACAVTGEKCPTIDRDQVREELEDWLGPEEESKAFNPNQHRGQPENAGQFGPGGGGTATKPRPRAGQPAAKPRPKKPKPQGAGTASGSIREQAEAVLGGKITPTKDRAFAGKPSSGAARMSKQLAGAVGEEIIIAHLKATGFADAGHLSDYLRSERNNLPADLVHDHQVVEVKTGQASNGTGAQQWRLTIGEPGNAEKEFLASATPEEKARHNQKKQAEIHKRKEQAIAEVGKELGYKIVGKTMTVILDPERNVADVYEFDGFHDRIGWTSDKAKSGYVGSYRYGA